MERVWRPENGDGMHGTCGVLERRFPDLLSLLFLFHSPP